LNIIHYGMYFNNDSLNGKYPKKKAASFVAAFYENQLFIEFS